MNEIFMVVTIWSHSFRSHLTTGLELPVFGCRTKDRLLKPLPLRVNKKYIPESGPFTGVILKAQFRVSTVDVS